MILNMNFDLNLIKLNLYLLNLNNFQKNKKKLN